MREAGVKSLVFSSSATVYGEPTSVPITESFPTKAANPYGRSNLMVEECLTDLQKPIQTGGLRYCATLTRLALIPLASWVKILKASLIT